jgi:hypothetical protein
MSSKIPLKTFKASFPVYLTPVFVKLTFLNFSHTFMCVFYVMFLINNHQFNKKHLTFCLYNDRKEYLRITN